MLAPLLFPWPRSAPPLLNSRIATASLPMKSFFNSMRTITKPQKKLKATPDAVDLAMDLLLSSQARKQSRISLPPI